MAQSDPGPVVPLPPHGGRPWLRRTLIAVGIGYALVCLLTYVTTGERPWGTRGAERRPAPQPQVATIIWPDGHKTVTTLGSLSPPPPTTMGSLQQVTLGDLTVRVPAEWRVDERASDAAHLLMLDPAHTPATAVSFSIASLPAAADACLAGATSVQSALLADERFAEVTARNRHLPDVHAAEISFRVALSGSLYRGIKYVVVHRGTGYVVTYEALETQAASHLDQFRASARSLSVVRGPYEPDLRTVTVTRTNDGLLSFRVGFRHPTRLADETTLQLMLDTDKDPDTGIEGAEYALDLSGGKAALLTAHGRDTTVSYPRSLRVVSTSTSTTLRVSAAAIGSPSSFGFNVFAERSGDRGDALIDRVPLEALTRPSYWTYPRGPKATARYASA